MITIIFGEPGKGKTALMTYFAKMKMLDDGFLLWTQSCKKIDVLKKGGYSKIEYLPQRHTVYADYDIKVPFPKTESYFVDGFELSLPNPFFETSFLPPYSQIFLDEAQKYYDSRKSKYIRECVYRFYQLHRHNHYDITMTCQRLGNIDLNIRQIAERFIQIKDLKIIKDEYGQIIKMVWSINEYDCLSDAENYIDNGNRTIPFKKQIYCYEGDIFRNYNSFCAEPVFYDGNENRNYDHYVENKIECTVEDYKRYNQTHMYVAPKGYYMNEKEDSKILKSILVI